MGSPELKRLLMRSLQSAPSAVLITDQTGRIEYANPSLTVLTGYTPSELRGQTPRLFKAGSSSTSPCSSC